MRFILACTLLAGGVEAQTLATRVARAGDATVRFSFPSRPDVCGDGEHNIQWGRHGRGYYRNADGRARVCQYGPVRVTMQLRGGAPVKLETAVGGEPEPATDLGTVGVREAVAYLLGVARTGDGRVGEAAVFPVVLADSVTPWPEMFTLARDTRVERRTRKATIFWLGQAAGDAVTAGLEEIADDRSGDREVRESAVFALSQLQDGEGIPALIRIARTNRDPEIRRNALFWLGQSEDPRALALFEELLAGT